MKILTAKCPDCGDQIYSRCNHDFRTCECGRMCVDAGPGVGRLMHKEIDKVVIEEVEVDATLKEIYADWNYNKNQYGVV